MTSPNHKLQSFEELLRKRETWSDRGQRLVLANGAFDMLHVGHLRYLASARAHGDVLVVAVNSDLSVRSAKGPDRPIIPEAERVEIVSHLQMVDWIFLFDDPTLDRILDLLRPEVHAKGTDYTVETVPERAVVKAYGGETVICGDPKEHATTDLVGLIVERFGDR